MRFKLSVDLRPMTDLAIQMVVGAALFVFVGLIGLGLSLFVDWLSEMGAPYWLTGSMHIIEIGLYGLDVFCFAAFLVNEGRRFVRSRDWVS